MILKMEKLSAACLLEDREGILRELQRAQCIQLRPADAMSDFEEIEALTDVGTAISHPLEQKQSRYGAALSAMSLYSKKRSLLTPKPSVAFRQLGNEEMMARAEELCGQIEAVTEEMSALRSQRGKDAFLRASLEPWRDNPLPLELEGTRRVSALYYLLPAKTDLAQLEAEQQEQAPCSLLRVLSTDREQQYLLALCHKEEEDALWNVLKGVGAARMSFGGLTGTVVENAEALDRKIAEADAAMARCEEKLRELGQDIYPLQYGFDALTVQVQQEKATQNFRRTDKTFCFTAWVPETHRQEAVGILEQYGCYFTLQEPDDEEEPPILLQNHRLVTPYEAVTNMYSPPLYRGFDPNNFVSFFYFLFFGMMLGDAGFGLLLFFGGLWLSRKTGMKGIVQVITMGGISSTIWGIVFGSYFGDVIPVVSETFFGRRVAPPIFIDPLAQAVLVMVICLALGFIHILVGMFINAYLLVKRGKAMDAIFDVGFWVLFMLGLVMLLIGVALPMMAGAEAPGWMMPVGKWMSIGGAVGLVLTQGRSAKNPAMKLLGGVKSLYDITGYLSDVLSYSRILALGLATGVIAQVFNIIGTLAGGGFFGAIVFIIVFAIGSALNVGINTLGAYVHTARLQYVEFFGKFYEAGGKPFIPFMPQTKYILVTKEEM